MNKILLTPRDFENKDVLYKELYIEKNMKSLILGKVLDNNHIPVKEAAVVIYKEDMTTGFKKLLGYTTTNENGIFAILVIKEHKVRYLLEVYGSLNDSNIKRLF